MIWQCLKKWERITIFWWFLFFICLSFLLGFEARFLCGRLFEAWLRWNNQYFDEYNSNIWIRKNMSLCNKSTRINIFIVYKQERRQTNNITAKQKRENIKFDSSFHFSQINILCTNYSSSLKSKNSNDKQSPHSKHNSILLFFNSYGYFPISYHQTMHWTLSFLSYPY